MDQKLLLFNPFINEQELTHQSEISSENTSRSTFPGVKADSNKMGLSSSSPKRRRVVQKRVVSVPIGDIDGSRQKGEGAPPSDSWAWRKYGQKPIKGSPYPRGYYRCSSSKGCPARKQVERSRSDPSMLMVTYACDHNHPWPISRNSSATAGATKYPTEEIAVFANPPEIEAEEKMELEDGFLGSDEFCWFPDVNSPTSKEGLLQSPICNDDHEALPEEKYGEDESFFADLGELPECSVVFRRGFTEIEENRRSLRAASWCGSTG